MYSSFVLIFFTQYGIFHCECSFLYCCSFNSVVCIAALLTLYSLHSALYLDPDDYTALNDSFQISSSALLQCVPISITSDSVEETGQECFSFSLSTATTISGLTLSPSGAEICISDAEGRCILSRWLNTKSVRYKAKKQGSYPSILILPLFMSFLKWNKYIHYAQYSVFEVVTLILKLSNMFQIQRAPL